MCFYWYCAADLKYDAIKNQPTETPTTHHAITRFKLTIVTIVSFRECLAIANISSCLEVMDRCMNLRLRQHLYGLIHIIWVAIFNNGLSAVSAAHNEVLSWLEPSELELLLAEKLSLLSELLAMLLSVKGAHTVRASWPGWKGSASFAAP